MSLFCPPGVRSSRAEKAQPNREVIRVTRPGVMGGLTGFSVAGGENTLAVSEVGRREVGRRSWRERDRAKRGGDECMGFAFGRRRDSYGLVGTCCLLIKCKRVASLSLDSPLRQAFPRVAGRPRSPFALLPSLRLPQSASVTNRGPTIMKSINP